MEAHTHGPAVNPPAEGGGVQVFGLQTVQHAVPHPRNAAERGGLDLAEQLHEKALNGMGWGAGGPPCTPGTQGGKLQQEEVGTRMGPRTTQVDRQRQASRGAFSELEERRKGQTGQEMEGACSILALTLLTATLYLSPHSREQGDHSTSSPTPTPVFAAHLRPLSLLPTALTVPGVRGSPLHFPDSSEGK